MSEKSDSEIAASGGTTPLDPRDMDPDQLFALLGLSDMDNLERLEFVRYMNAWSRQYLPGPNTWWIQALLQANLWKRTITNHIDSLITQALGQ
ncbi:Uncharacterised protein [Mycobacteroides abscessus subsp. abscessus]|uniref:hypothetical protein n=1 Tax=Mycobacteroides abscessus TaxID=36809 RepID=UPI000929AB86|nr:hypothetical protein [Mycobacteroides abscessus]MDO3312383.1 hypothetical protein [Mycobacteroides abscessus subsp. abscessus]MDO3344935.1 hypothetical protein [Mycobacteroides abscessus subsp. abscessus]SHP09662.1 Uncharacterised protein [Mycobacteroides abscessus subsp. abscessus]SHP23649.1 Uncharacterised protein [Mycobacteroides abscessus subsp. abscessus]SHP94527.1 Uncharacterised protein [Mycobacteroides abscessus subsp. abscessus]